MKNQKMFINKWMWWNRGACVVEVLHAGHFPTTVMVKMPDDSTIEVELCDLDMPKDI